MKNNKKGISAVVATVLIILITVAAVTIIWAAIIPMVKDNLDRGTICLNAMQQLNIMNKGYTCYDSTVTPNVVRVQVAHGPRNISLVGIQVLVSDALGDTNSTVVRTGLPQPNGEKVIVAPYSGANPASVKIAPLVLVGGAEETCDALSAVQLRACS